MVFGIDFGRRGARRNVTAELMDEVQSLRQAVEQQDRRLAKLESALVGLLQPADGAPGQHDDWLASGHVAPRLPPQRLALLHTVRLDSGERISATAISRGMLHAPRSAGSPPTGCTAAPNAHHP